jgi:hypothetical protein
MAPHEISKPSGVLFQLAWKTFSYSYGTFTLGAFVLLAYVRKSSFRKLDTKGKKELALGKSELHFRLSRLRSTCCYLEYSLSKLQ